MAWLLDCLQMACLILESSKQSYLLYRKKSKVHQQKQSKMIRSIVCILISLFAFGCNPIRYVNNRVIQNDTTIIIKDSIVVIPADSSLVNAYFECDSNNKVIMKELATYRGRKVNPIVIWKNNWLTVASKVDSESVYLTWKELHISNKDTSVQIIEKIERVYPKWLVTLSVVGVLAILVIVLMLISKFKIL